MIFSQFSSMSTGKKIAVFMVIGVFLLAPVVLYGFSQKESIVPENTGQPSKPTLAPFPSKDSYIPDQLVVRFKPMQGPDELEGSEVGERLKDEFGVVSWEKMYPGDEYLEFSGFYVLYFQKDTDVEKVAQEIYSLPEVMGLEPNVEAGIN